MQIYPFFLLLMCHIFSLRCLLIFPKPSLVDVCSLYHYQLVRFLCMGIFLEAFYVVLLVLGL